MRTYNIKPTAYFYTVSQFTLFFFLFVMVYYPIIGQNGQQQKLLQPDDYFKWHKIRFPLISGDGKWASYLLEYEQPNDTLIVIDMNGKSKHEFSNARDGQFAPSKSPKLFAFNDDHNGIGVLNLIDGTTTWINEARYFEFSMDGKYLACYNLNHKNGYLNLIEIEKNKSTIIRGIQNFKFDPSSKALVLITKEANIVKVELLKLDMMHRFLILTSESSEFLYPTWNTSGNALVFMESSTDSKQRLYYFEDKETSILKELNNINFKRQDSIEISKVEPFFSNDGERVFFSTHNKMEKPKREEPDSVKVQVWKGSDKLVYPRAKLYQEFEVKDKIAVWWPKTDKVFQIGNTERPKVILTGDQKFALSYNPVIYEPLFKETPLSDFYITNLETGKLKLLLKKMETAYGYMSVSPNGKNIAYFMDNNWWFYNILKNEHVNCTDDFDFPLTYKHAPSTARNTPYGLMGWTNNNEFLIYDEFDVWKINAKDKQPICLTNGREQKIHFRKYFDLEAGFYPLGKSDKDHEYNLSENIIFNTQDSLYNFGFTIRKSNGKVKPLINGSGKISALRKAKFSDSYIYIKEKNNTPQVLSKKEIKTNKVLAQSNSHQNEFAIGKTELIFYKNKEGEQLRGLLHYPDNYKLGKQYPMIVHIYELQSSQYQNYTNPSYYNQDGFNLRNFTASGYFVLEPDIQIQNKKPGISATDCVVTAVKKVLKKEIIDKNAIGLIGHSFGGYETAFIITQTDLFAAAVVGAGVFDLISFANKINLENGDVGFGDVEDSQWKMEKPYYDDKENYSKNSPIEHADKINIPTLIWTGDNDRRIDWNQSLEMYLIMRRLGATVELLVYQNEIHVLTKKENQKDLTERIEKWFSKYLK